MLSTMASPLEPVLVWVPPITLMKRLTPGLRARLGVRSCALAVFPCLLLPNPRRGSVLRSRIGPSQQLADEDKRTCRDYGSADILEDVLQQGIANSLSPCTTTG